MDCDGNHCYQPYAPPSSFNGGRSYHERSWLSNGDSRCPRMSRGILSNTFASGNRGERNPSHGGRGVRNLPGTFQGRSHEGVWDSRVKICQYGPSPEWLPGTLLYYGPLCSPSTLTMKEKDV